MTRNLRTYRCCRYSPRRAALRTNNPKVVIPAGEQRRPTNASFAFWLVQGFGSQATVVRHYELARRRINDRPDPGDEGQENIDLGAEFGQPDVIGPSVIDLDSHSMALLTRGLAEDDFGTDDPAANFRSRRSTTSRRPCKPTRPTATSSSTPSRSVTR
ncbi:hypothetical protein [Antrihabitans cavernicola]|uniref:Uncharacterized protein n=1 Tax=Antrihabitans cavernicola TaxID=2495913 RepID=A0A5A7S2X4_9NOCA|nr:hypothetical protein [Spelaeibacter cavernicola]KAA0018493.1 hypothetical protein FOY51_23730 [Spelaeibacter cavernicola]